VDQSEFERHEPEPPGEQEHQEGLLAPMTPCGFVHAAERRQAIQGLEQLPAES
jgi:hypothetical protein